MLEKGERGGKEGRLTDYTAQMKEKKCRELPKNQQPSPFPHTESVGFERNKRDTLAGAGWLWVEGHFFVGCV